MRALTRERRKEKRGRKKTHITEFATDFEIAGQLSLLGSATVQL